MRRHLSATLLLLILCSLILSACGSARRTQQPTVAVTRTAAPTATRTKPIVTNTPYASQTPRPGGGTRTPIYPTHPPTETPTLTPFPASTPEEYPEAYRLKPWDYRTAFRLFDEAESILLPEEYESLRLFYKLSMLEEIYLKMPEYKDDYDLLRERADLKGLGNSYWEPYGLIHDHSVMPFLEILERELNEEEVTPTSLQAWVSLNGVGYLSSIETSNRLFENAATATVMNLRAGAGRNFFIVSKDTGGHFTVHALYPEWVPERWDNETFQITDLNANGRDEIAVTYNGWGTGMSHFCNQKFTVYEWNGSTFENLMADEFGVVTGTDYSDCLPVTFLPDPSGGQMIQYGVTYYTPCPETAYQEILLLHWDGKRFQLDPSSGPNKPKAGPPDRCTIDWALDAGPGDTAISQMEIALANWPVEAEQEWGPASRDFLRLKLATWYLQGGQVEQGLALLREIRDNPFTPEYPLPAKAADFFISAYEAHGLYQAFQEMNTLFWNEQDAYCAYDICMKEEMFKAWGYFEPQWEYGISSAFPGEFSLTKAVNIKLQQDLPKSMGDLKTWLNGINLKLVWSVQGDMDGQGKEDWLLTVKDERGEDGCPIFKFYAYLQNETGSDLVYLYMLDYSIGSEYCGNVIDFEPSRWNSFPSDTNTEPINVLETPYEIASFRFVKEDGKTEIKEVLSLSKKLYWVDDDPGLLIHDWSIDNGRLIVEYTDRQVTYIWSANEGKFVPTGNASELQEENIARAEQAIYISNQPTQAVGILNAMLKVRIWENPDSRYGRDDDPPWVRPYVLYLLGLAYEQAGDSDNAVRAYWQLWHDYPTNPYSIAAQSKLERK